MLILLLIMLLTLLIFLFFSWHFSRSLYVFPPLWSLQVGNFFYSYLNTFTIDINKIKETKTKIYITVIRCKATITLGIKLKTNNCKISGLYMVKIFFFSIISRKEGTWIVLLILYIIVTFNMSLLTDKLQLRLSYRNVWINWSLPWDKICSLMFLILFKRWLNTNPVD